MTRRRRAPPAEFVHGSGAYTYRGVTLVRGEGARLFDDVGRSYWDAGASYGCANVGHAHPRVLEAVLEQAQDLTYASGAFGNDARSQLVEALVDRAPEQLDSVFLSNSGTEAIEAAVKLAMNTTGRDGIVALEGGFHGRTLGALAATHRAAHRKPFEARLAPAAHVPVGDLDRLHKHITEDTAAVLVEAVQGEGGVRPVPDEFLVAVRERCDETGALLVADEVQTGLARTGPFFGFQHADITPDVICMAKSLAAGLPLGATIFNGDAGRFHDGLHGSTFGGNPVACAAATAVLDVIHDEELVARSQELGAWAFERLEALREHDAVVDVRGRGMMLAIELDTRATPVLRRLQNVGVLALPAGSDAIRLLPPLTIPRDALDECISALDTILGTMQ